jgi:hypothetical protein
MPARRRIRAPRRADAPVETAIDDIKKQAKDAKPHFMDVDFM